ncbi:hypothetical protein M2459_003595 [Parabacteroides sp. PF5-5]|uniref:hypothetical protein n=1 Tax=unclassified Parabacteroides TaxID=2649774 RepID=UPI0024751704|nr:MULTISPECIES: hypothetical protein [unclassified Parabacteroides]MDH6306972.1 hypothetical protein [Parabacteroides sp. PH5-39]MDH6317846.1 hypothetical protein [Parabacteroides sp. PF5-13]MDH6321577.1 hypothetical protein [Parabacteroides sp. PH5-13]MDH6325347.1 hypothetical protein [Parabacteroides sp. PH5-8]MDH6329018.1 hypothetical protein [Parabacteroides sp. PH5-41]
MGFIREPLDVDFIVESRPLTDKEKSAISEYIRADKEKRRQIGLQRKSNQKKIKQV